MINEFINASNGYDCTRSICSLGVWLGTADVNILSACEEFWDPDKLADVADGSRADRVTVPVSGPYIHGAWLYPKPAGRTRVALLPFLLSIQCI